MLISEGKPSVIKIHVYFKTQCSTEVYPSLVQWQLHGNIFNFKHWHATEGHAANLLHIQLILSQTRRLNRGIYSYFLSSDFLSSLNFCQFADGQTDRQTDRQMG